MRNLEPNQASPGPSSRNLALGALIKAKGDVAGDTVWRMLPAWIRPLDARVSENRLHESDQAHDESWYMDVLSQLHPVLQIKVLLVCQPEIAGRLARRLHVSLEEFATTDITKEKALLHRTVADGLNVHLQSRSLPSWVAPVLENPFRFLLSLGEMMTRNREEHSVQSASRMKALVNSLGRSRISYFIRLGIIRLAWATARDHGAADAIMCRLSRIPGFYYLKAWRWASVIASASSSNDERKLICTDISMVTE